MRYHWGLAVGHIHGHDSTGKNTVTPDTTNAKLPSIRENGDIADEESIASDQDKHSVGGESAEVDDEEWEANSGRTSEESDAGDPNEDYDDEELIDMDEMYGELHEVRFYE